MIRSRTIGERLAFISYTGKSRRGREAHRMYAQQHAYRMHPGVPSPRAYCALAATLIICLGLMSWAITIIYPGGRCKYVIMHGSTYPGGLPQADPALFKAHCVCDSLHAGWSRSIHHRYDSPRGGIQGCPRVAQTCLDALIVYHEDDVGMLINNGGLESAIKHLKGIRTFFILSASNQTFR
jgi:hypothetical protein